MTLVVSQSKIKAWRKCRRLYYYKHVLLITPRKPRIPLLRGNIIHKCQEELLRGKDYMAPIVEAEKQYEKMFAEEQEMYQEVIPKTKALMTAYAAWYKNDPLKPIKSKSTGLISEHEIRVDLLPGIEFRGKIDVAARSRDGAVWMMDHKSVKKIPETEFRYWDIQSAAYTSFMSEAGLPEAEGVCWNYLRTSGLNVPEKLKSGEMSRRQIDTLWPIYRAELVKNNLDPKDYEDVKERLADNESRYFHRSYLPVNEKIRGTLMKELKTTAREIKAKGGVDKTRTTEQHCSWCEYFAPCQAALRGLDEKGVIKHDFRPKEAGEYHADQIEAE